MRHPAPVNCQADDFSLAGVIAGSMTDPPALAFSTKLTSPDYPSLAYANVYPLTMLRRILGAQIAVLWLGWTAA